MSYQYKTIAALLAATFAFSGCATTRMSGEAEKGVKDNVKTVDAELKSVLPEQARLPMVEHNNGVWLGNKTTAIIKEQQLPAIFSSNVTFDNTVTLQEAASRITLRYGVPVKLAKEITAGASMGASAAPAAPAASPAGGAGQTNANLAKISYTGPLSGLLDIVASRFGANWKYQNGAIQFFYMDTRTFAIRAIPGDVTSASQVSNSSATSGGGAAGAGSTSSTSISNKLSVWEGLRDSVSTMLSSTGKVVVSVATGSLTVTDTPEILDRVESFVNAQNESMSRQVMFNVKVYSISLSDTDNYQVNWNFVYNSLNKNFGMKLTNAFSSPTGSTGVDLKVLSTATGNAAKFSGTDVLFNALSTQGKTSLLTSATVSTLNAQPVPVQVARQTSYLQSVSTTVTANVGTTSTLTPGTFTTGFNMNLLPNILDKGQLLLQYSIDLSVLNKLTTISSGGNTIQTPEIDTRNFLQRVAMNTGETLILTGFEQNTDVLQHQGTVDPKFVAAGGGTTASKGRDIVVVAITPIITSAR